MTKRRLLIGIGEYLGAASLIAGLAVGTSPTAGSTPADVAVDGPCAAGNRHVGICCPVNSALSISDVPTGQCSNATPVGANQFTPPVAPPTGPAGPGPTGPPHVGDSPLGGVTDTLGHVVGGVTGAVGGPK